MMNEESSDILVIERNGMTCGISYVDYVCKPETPYMMASNFYYVQEMAVDESFRHQGVAKELFEFMKDDAEKRKLNKAELDVWAFNEPAIEFL